MTDQLTLVEEIKRLKKEKNAIILAHNYQREEIQDVADLVGDSFALSQKAASTDADVIVFCGVHFMAESAAILAPHKTVLLPELQAGCPMAEMVNADALREKKRRHPNATVVCYVNSSAAVKAECDICCTSSNAVQVVESIDNEEIIFVPDRNLGNYVSKQTGKKLILWEGFCWTHEQITKEDVLEAKAKYPDAEVLVHPECIPEVVAMADKAFSTSGIIKYVQESDKKNFIIGTEMGILHQLKKNDPEKNYYVLSDKMMCPNMKLTTLEKLHRCLLNMEPVIKVPEDIRVKAQLSLERMLAIK